MARFSFDTERFIQEIELRESIWNQKCAEYSDKHVKIRHWNELVDIFGGTDLSSQERTKLGESIQKKWKNIRDCFVKEHKRIKTLKSGSECKKKSPYAFYAQLSFLKDVITLNLTESNLVNAEDRSENTNEICGPYTKNKENKENINKNKKQKLSDDDIGKELINVLNQSQAQRATFENDSDRQFFLSLVEDFKKIPEYLKCRTKCQILEVINNAQIVNATPYTNYEYPVYPGPSGYQTARGRSSARASRPSSTYRNPTTERSSDQAVTTTENEIICPEEAYEIMRACEAISPASVASQFSQISTETEIFQL